MAVPDCPAIGRSWVQGWCHQLIAYVRTSASVSMHVSSVVGWVVLPHDSVW